MYSPKIKEDLIRELYRRKQIEKRPMTKLVNDAVMQYLKQINHSTTKQTMEAENVSRHN